VVVLTMAKRSDGSPGAVVVAAILGLGLLLLILKWLVVTAAILVVPFGLWWVWDHHRQGLDRRRAQEREARRHAVEARAVLDAAGGCGWCGMATGHRDHRTGARITPRAFHRHEVDQALDALPS
jgi:ABC-type nickel/cobalt efflux system permease component RcnA